jgi:glycosyltransferase involved in cell wall biosynthesis
MKICMLAPEFLPIWGGVGTYIVELLKHLPKNVEVHVVTPIRKGWGKESASSYNFDFSTHFGSNIRIHFLGNAQDTFFYNGEFQSLCALYVPKLVNEEKIELIHSHTAHMPDLLLQFRRIKTPIVSTIHTTIGGQRNGTKRSGMSFSDLEFSEKITFAAYPFLSLAEKLYFLKKRYYITVSNWMKNHIMEQYPRINSKLISIVHNSVDTRLFSPSKTRSDNDIILFTGRLIAAKGINYLVETVPSVLKDHPDAKFVFIGAGNSAPYQKRFKQLGITEKNFRFVGYLKEAYDLVQYYRASSVYLAPTLYENFPIRVLEAMACGAPVVASNVCALPEAIDDGRNGLLIKPGSVSELTNAICELLDDPTLRMRLGVNARNTVMEKFDLDFNAIKTVGVYRQVLEDYYL